MFERREQPQPVHDRREREDRARPVRGVALAAVVRAAVLVVQRDPGRDEREAEHVEQVEVREDAAEQVAGVRAQVGRRLARLLEQPPGEPPVEKRLANREKQTNTRCAIGGRPATNGGRQTHKPTMRRRRLSHFSLNHGDGARLRAVGRSWCGERRTQRAVGERQSIERRTNHQARNANQPDDPSPSTA